MKIKQDFVTNSSSTNFCAWGYEISFYNSEFPEPFLKKAYEYYINGKRVKEPISYELFRERIKNWDDNETLFDDSIIDYLEKSDLDTAFDWEGEQLYIGRSPFYMPDNITPSEYKKQISNDLKGLGLDLGELQIIVATINC